MAKATKLELRHVTDIAAISSMFGVEKSVALKMVYSLQDEGYSNVEIVRAARKTFRNKQGYMFASAMRMYIG